jgi:hypothetical protein
MTETSQKTRSSRNWIKDWKSLAKIATWILGIISSFWLSPPIQQGESQPFLNATRFIVAVLIAISVYFAVKYQKHYHAKGWLTAAILSLSVFIGAWFLYDHIRTGWICNVNGELIVMGGDDAFTDKGKENSEKPECTGCQNLIFECGMGSTLERKAESIWEKEGIESRRRKLIAVYFATIPFLVVCIISSLQILHCIKQRDVRLNFHGFWEGLSSDGGKLLLELHLPLNRKRISGRWKRTLNDQEPFDNTPPVAQPIQNARVRGETLFFRVLDGPDAANYEMSLSSATKEAILDRENQTGNFELFCSLKKINNTRRSSSRTPNGIPHT